MSMHANRNRFWPAYVLGLVTALVAGVVWQTLTPAANAQSAKRPEPRVAAVLDPGRQRDEMIQQLREANKKLAEMTKILAELRQLEKTQAEP